VFFSSQVASPVALRHAFRRPRDFGSIFRSSRLTYFRALEPERFGARGEAAGRRTIEDAWQVVSRLPMAQRTAVVVYYRENLTVKEVAEAMGVSPDTVKTHLVRARSRIQVELTARRFDEGDIS
jgi:DNA-directed RNA polymerase specialized sigma24 family protein